MIRIHASLEDVLAAPREHPAARSSACGCAARTVHWSRDQVSNGTEPMSASGI